MDHTSYEYKFKDGRNKKVQFSRPKMMTTMMTMTIMITF